MKNGNSNPKLTNRERARQLLNHGAELLKQGNTKDAIARLEQAHQMDAASVPVLLNLGSAYIMEGKHKEAVPLLETASRAEPENAMIWTNLGAAYLGNPVLATSEKQIRAIRAFEKAISLDPTVPHVHYNLGLVFLDRQQVDLAVSAFRKALEINPKDNDARYWLRKLEPGESG